MPLLTAQKLRTPAQQCGFRICKLQFHQTAFNGLSLTENFRNIRGTGQDSFQDLDDLGFIDMPFFKKRAPSIARSAGKMTLRYCSLPSFLTTKTWTRNFLCIGNPDDCPCIQTGFQGSVKFLMYRRTSGPEKTPTVVKESLAYQTLRKA